MARYEVYTNLNKTTTFLPFVQLSEEGSGGEEWDEANNAIMVVDQGPQGIKLFAKSEAEDDDFWIENPEVIWEFVMAVYNFLKHRREEALMNKE